MILWRVKSIPQFTLPLNPVMNQTNCPSWQNHLVTSCVVTDAILEHFSHATPKAFRLKQSVGSITGAQCCHSLCWHWPGTPASLKQRLHLWLCHTALSGPSLPPLNHWRTECDGERWLECLVMVRPHKECVFNWGCCHRFHLLVFMPHLLDGNSLLFFSQQPFFACQQEKHRCDW